MKCVILATVATLAILSAATPAVTNHVLHEKRETAPRHWVKRSRLASHIELPMRIGLTQSNLDQGEELLMKIADPDSTHYGKHYSQDEIIELFAPLQDAVDATIQWLQSMGLSKNRISQSINKQWVQFDATVEEAERLFNTKYYSWEHHQTGKTHVACDKYHVPEHIKHHIDYITPGIKLISGIKGSGIQDFKAKREIVQKRQLPGPILGPIVNITQGLTKPELLKLCGELITPPCITAMYNITEGTKASPHNQMGIFEEGDMFSQSDLTEFFTLLAPEIDPNTRPTVDGIDGGTAPNIVGGDESNLDLQISYPIIYPQNSVIFQTDDDNYANSLRPGQGFINTFLDAIDGSYCSLKAFGINGSPKIDPKYPDPAQGGYKGKLMCGKYTPTNVISISYGEQEDDLPTNYQQRQCLEFMKLGMQGISVVIASGDSGVSARSADDGNSNGCLGTNGTVFSPDFPASCPYVTALGATELPVNGDPSKDEEQAVTAFPSGGGFSNIYPRPKYQGKAVSTYFSQHDPQYPSYMTKHTNNPPESVTAGGRYNRAGRGYPDAAAIGNNVVIVLLGAPRTAGGTSASTPVFGAILNRINEERLSMGKGTVGFVNPTLYKHPEMFHDITSGGSNSGCGTNGFSPVSGWDPVTGLGTPNYPEMLKVFKALP